jgi:starch-binding outer membrane protein, SusD/RagB family
MSTKYIFKNSFLIVLIMAFMSCGKELELLPEQSLDSNIAFASAAAAEASLNGVYSECQALEVFGSSPQIMEDLMADNTEFVGSFPTIQEVRNYITISTNVTIQGHWQIMYRLINGANTVIDKVPAITDPAMTPEKAASIIGQAKFLRAITYFQLVNQFAQPYNKNNGSSPGVPLVLTGFTGTVEFPARATVAEVHNQIIKDLTEAMAVVPATFAGTLTRGRATKGACAGFLSRIHLYRGEYQKAADFAKQVIDSKATYGLSANLNFYSQLTSEDVFVVINTPTDNGRTGTGGWGSYHRPAAQGGRGDCAFTANLEAAFAEEAGDLRYSTLSDMVTAADNVMRRMTKKFPDALTNADESPLMRIAEMHLNRAEALAELNGVNQESIDLVNPIRTRAGLSAWNIGQFASKQALIDAILKERRKELCFEGHRRMDLLRRGLPLRTTGTTAALAAFGADRTIMPIPQREVDLNINLVQNPGY